MGSAGSRSTSTRRKGCTSPSHSGAGRPGRGGSGRRPAVGAGKASDQLPDERQGLAVGPMDVFEQHRRGMVGGEAVGPGDEVGQATVASWSAVTAGAPGTRCRDRSRETVRPIRPCPPRGLRQSPPRSCRQLDGGVAVEKRRTAQPGRPASGRGDGGGWAGPGPSGTEPPPDAARPALELVEQPRLADTRLAGNGHDPAASTISGGLKLMLKPLELGPAPDRPRFNALDPTGLGAGRARLRPPDDVGRTGSDLPRSPGPRRDRRRTHPGHGGRCRRR